MHRLFLIHGMGRHPAGWSEPFVRQLAALAAQYPGLAGRPLDGRVAFHEIVYDDIFRGVAAQENVLWEYAGDVALYRLSAEVRQGVRAAVARQLAEGIQADLESRQQCRFTILAHSLGTAVAHDAFHALLEQGGAFAPRHIKADAVFQVANVSKALETAPGVYHSYCRPGPSDGAENGAVQFFNCRHTLDPFPRLRPFAPAGWGPEYREITVSHILGKDVHSLEHYLAHPAVHIPLLRVLAGPQRIPAAVEQEALAAFRERAFARSAELALELAAAPALSGGIEMVREVAQWYQRVLNSY